MSGRSHYDDDDLDGAPEPDPFEVEGIQAFNRLTGVVQGLESRLTDLEHGLGAKANQVERAAATAQEAAKAARTAAEHAGAAGLQHAKSRSAASWAFLGALAGILAAGGIGYWRGQADGRGYRPG